MSAPTDLEFRLRGMTLKAWQDWPSIGDEAAAAIAALRAENSANEKGFDYAHKEVLRLTAVLDLHNADCQARCGVGDLEATTCGYRPYFINSGRRCPTCPVYDMIDYERPVSDGGGSLP